MNDRMGACHPDCYKKELGCIVANNGKCPYIFAREGAPTYNLKDWQKELIKSISTSSKIKDVKFSKPKRQI